VKKSGALKRVTALVLILLVGIGGCFTTSFAETSITEQGTKSEAIVDETVADEGINEDETTGGEITEDIPGDDTAGDAIGDENTGDDTDTVVSNEIAAVKPLKKSVKTQTIVAYSGKKPVLPETVSVKMTDSENYEDIAVTWKASKAYKNKVAGTYKYTGRVSEKYTFADGVTIPKITVKVAKCKTKISGTAATLTKKSRKALYDKVTVYNGYGSKLKLQMYNSKTGKWVTKKKITLKNSAKQVVNVKYIQVQLGRLLQKGTTLPVLGKQK